MTTAKNNPCTICGKPGIPGLLKGQGKCQYHWNAGVWGKAWADTRAATATETRKLTFEQAKARYVHRFTMEHVPQWAKSPRPDGTFYAPQFSTDREWFDNTKFPGEEGHFGPKTECYTTGQTWPLGQDLDKPFTR